MIYVSSPYFHTDANIRKQRYEDVQRYVYDLYTKGQWCYSPILHYHPMAIRYNMSLDANAWFQSNFHLLKHSDELHVLRLIGWETAPGVQADIAFMTNTQGAAKIKFVNLPPTAPLDAPVAPAAGEPSA